MPYHNIAKRLASEGRGGDTTLVHMSKGEVKSLQDLAMAHGGSLTTNPHTGLPEAGFLSNILPMVAGGALTYFSGGALSPMAAAMIAGGGTALVTGDIKKGLSAGLGAYGGAGLSAGLMGAGTAAAQSALPAFGDPNIAADMVANTASTAQASPFTTMGQGLSSLTSSGAAGEAARAGFMSGVGGAGGLTKYGLAALSPMMFDQQQAPAIAPTKPVNQLEYRANPVLPTPSPQDFGREQRYFNPQYVDTGRKFVPGQVVPMADGGPTGAYREPGTPRSDMADTGANTMFPMSVTPTSVYATAFQQPSAENVLNGPQDMRVDPYTGEERLARGGISHLGDYSDGGRMLRGPGDGVSDSIPATIGGKQPARLADGEFVVPARIVSELGNGSSEAGARKLYAMMDRVQSARKKSVGKGNVAKNTKSEKYLPA